MVIGWGELTASFSTPKGTSANLEFKAALWLYHCHFIRELTLNTQIGLWCFVPFTLIGPIQAFVL